MNVEVEAIINDERIMAGDERALGESLQLQGKFDEARNVLKGAMAALEPEDTEELLAYRNLLCKVERGAGRIYEALRIHLETYTLAELSGNEFERARFHNGLGLTYKQVAVQDSNSECFDKALIEYEAARHFFEVAGDLDGAGYVENNVALVLSELGRNVEAHEHLTKAEHYFSADQVRFAEIQESRARVYLREENPRAALSAVIEAIRVFDRHDEKKLLDQSLPTLIKASVDYQAGPLKTLSVGN